MPLTRSQGAIQSECLQDEAEWDVEKVQPGCAVCEDTESNASEIRLLLAEQKDIMNFDRLLNDSSWMKCENGNRCKQIL